MAHPTLTAFCTTLTGISQAMVSAQPTFPVVLGQFLAWYDKNQLDSHNTTVVTCGNWDLATMLPGQSRYSQVKVRKIISA